MPVLSPDERLKKLEEAQRDLNEKIKKARIAKSKEERKKDTRRKVLLGSMLMASIESGHREREDVMAELGEYLERDHDRELFDLPPNQEHDQEMNERVSESSDLRISNAKTLADAFADHGI